MKKYILYYRVSTDTQGKSGLGLEAQKFDIDLYLNNYAKDDHEVIGAFTEVKSGKSEHNRPKLQEALALAEKTGATLLVDKLDRLSRRVSFIASLMESKTVSFKVASLPQAKNLELHLFAAMAEQEREFISIRTKAALSRARKRGVKLGGANSGTARTGLEALKFYQAHGQAIKRIIRSSHGNATEAARGLKAAKIPTRNGGNWSAVQVKRVVEILGIE